MRLARTFFLLVIVSLVAVTSVEPVAAKAPYEAYTYNDYRDSVPLAAPYLPERSVQGTDLGVGNFKEPNDIYVTGDGFIYILDSGNNRIICTDANWNVIRIISTFMNDGKSDMLRNPSGIFVTTNKEIYVADTDNNRIIILTNEGEMLRIVDNPQSDILPSNFKFTPVKITVDKANRLFVVARGVYEGLMQFDEKGLFIGYVGTISVTQSFTEKIWLRLATDVQRERMRLYIPTEFASVDIDHKGFVYSTNLDMNTERPIKRLNPSGQDVIKRLGYYPNMGDVRFRNFGNNSGPSRLIDIKVIGGGMYTALDSFRGRLFTYNDEGFLLYAFGAKGTQSGLFNTPVAVEMVGDQLVVLDRGKNSIEVFRPTQFGAAVHKATQLQYEGNGTDAVEVWREVLTLNSNFDIAYLGIGKSLLMEKKNKEAMEYFKLGIERKYYSVAFKRYRREVMQEHFSTFMTVLFILLISLLTWFFVRKWTLRRSVKHETRAV